MELYLGICILLTAMTVEVSCAFSDCGVVPPLENSSITNKTRIETKIFPWHVLIYDKVSPGYITLICGGTLISSNVVISAARCFYDEILCPKIDPNNHHVVAGSQYRLNDWPKNHYQESGVSYINIRNEFKGFMGDFAEDIALLILKDRFTLTPWVTPICLDLNMWKNKVELESGEVGTAMGCGNKSNSYISSKIERMNLTYVPREKCMSLIPGFATPLLTADKFCTTYLNGSSFCRSDQGGGIYFQYDGRWYLRGVLSITSFFGRSFDHRHPVMFTDVGRIVDEINNNKDTRKCGIAERLTNPFLLNGFRVEPGVLPWQVAIYQKNGTEIYEQICAGTLISSNVIVSAAHCFYDDVKKEKIDAKKFAIAAVKHDRPWNWPEKFVQKSAVQTIHLPRRYNGLDGLYAADIAWLILETPLKLTQFVKPICLDADDTLSDELQVGQVGKVGSWGTTVSGSPSNELRDLDLPVISRAECISAFPPIFSPYVTDDKFCAGYLNGTSLCNGDSGGGLAFYRYGRWYLRGIVSITIRKGNTCDPNYYTAFTDVQQFTNELREFTNISNYDLI